MSIIIDARKGNRQVFVYNPAKRDKEYVGFVGPCTGSGNARICKCVECKRGRALEATEAAKLAEGPRIVHASVTEWAQTWLDTMHGPGTARPSSTTRRHNEERVKAFVSEFGQRRLATITDDEAEDFALEHPGRIKAVKAMFNDAARKRRIAQDPFRMVHKPRTNGRDNITPLTETEIASLAGIARSRFGAYGVELAALITFAAWTGIRPGELCGLETPEVDRANRVLYVEWQRRKDGARVRTKTKVNREVPLIDQALEALQVVPQRSGAVFRAQTGGTLRPEMLSLYWRPVRDEFSAGLPPGHWLSRRLRQDPKATLALYEVRHHFGSVLGDQGLSARDIAAVMGNSPEVCERTYVHRFQNRVQDRVRAALESAAGNLEEVAIGSPMGSRVA